MMVNDAIEEIHIYCQTPFGDHSVRFLRVADNHVLLVIDANIVGLFNLEDQQALTQWLARRVRESL